MASQRFLSGQSPFVTEQQAGSVLTALHINDDSLHRAIDDEQTSYSSLWSSSKIANAISALESPEPTTPFVLPNGQPLTSQTHIVTATLDTSSQSIELLEDSDLVLSYIRSETTDILTARIPAGVYTPTELATMAGMILELQSQMTDRSARGPLAVKMEYTSDLQWVSTVTEMFFGDDSEVIHEYGSSASPLAMIMKLRSSEYMAVQYSEINLAGVPPVKMEWTPQPSSLSGRYVQGSRGKRRISNTTIERDTSTTIGHGFFGFKAGTLHAGSTFTIKLYGEFVTDNPPGNLTVRLKNRHTGVLYLVHAVPIYRDITNIDAATVLALSNQTASATAAYDVATQLANTAAQTLRTAQEHHDTLILLADRAASQPAVTAASVALTAALAVMATTLQTLSIVQATSPSPQSNFFEMDLRGNWEENSNNGLQVCSSFSYGYSYDNVARHVICEHRQLADEVDVEFMVTMQWSDARPSNSIEVMHLLFEEIF
jgi:hypothetical protein